MHVLMVLCDFGMGGAERAALQLAGALAAPDVRFTVASARRGGCLAEAFARAGACVVDGLMRFRLDALAAARVARVVTRGRVDVLLIVDAPRNGMFCGLAGAALSRRRPARICWCHSVRGHPGRQLERARAYWRAGLLDRVVCISEHQRSQLEALGLPREAMPVIHNGIDVDRYAGVRPAELDVPDGKAVLVQVANFMAHKDFDTLLAAAGALARRRGDFHLLLVGRGTDSPAVRGRAARAGAQGVVSFLGGRLDVPAILAAADVFVLSSRFEVFSLAALEAMAASLPVVVNGGAAFDEMFTDGVEGRKVPPADPDALAGALGELLDAPALRRRLGAAARQRARQFDLARMAAGFRDLLAACEESPT